MKLFLDQQGYVITENIAYRENQATMKLEMNGESSSGKSMRRFDINFFHVRPYR
jgi:hypothetical protein